MRVRPYVSVWVLGLLTIGSAVAAGVVGIYAAIVDYEYRHNPTPTIHDRSNAGLWSVGAMETIVTMGTLGAITMTLWAIQRQRSRSTRVRLSEPEPTLTIEDSEPSEETNGGEE